MAEVVAANKLQRDNGRLVLGIDVNGATVVREGLKGPWQRTDRLDGINRLYSDEVGRAVAIDSHGQLWRLVGPDYKWKPVPVQGSNGENLTEDMRSVVLASSDESLVVGSDRRMHDLREASFFPGLRNLTQRIAGENIQPQATQSSTAHNGVAGRAIDGNTDGVYARSSVTHTAENDKQSWWEVDLGAVREIYHVKLFNRTDCCTDRLRNFNILISNERLGSGAVVPTAKRVIWRGAFGAKVDEI